MKSTHSTNDISTSHSSARRIEEICRQFELDWNSHSAPKIERCLEGLADSERDELFEALVRVEVRIRGKRGDEPSLDEMLERFPDNAELLQSLFAGQTKCQITPSFYSDESTSGGSREEPPDNLQCIGRYTIDGEIGRGGMGVVYLAHDDVLKRSVALKLVLHGRYAHSEEVRHFRLEAESVAQLQHPNIVQIYEIGEQDRQPYIAFEYVAGGSLAGVLRDSPLSPEKAAQLGETLSRAIHAAHSKGIIHRDLKPSNILLAEDGTPKIADFGLAKHIDEETQTVTGVLKGTPSYMAPEQTLEKSARINASTDVYALGALLYECLTGRPPFMGATTFDTLAQVRAQEPVPVRQLQPRVPRDLETVCLKCLQKDVNKRYASADELADDLARFLDHRPILARPVGPAERALKWIKRRPTVSMLLGAVAMITIVAFSLVMWQWNVAVAARDEKDRALRKQAKIAAEERKARTEKDEALKKERQATLEKGLALKKERQATLDKDLALKKERAARKAVTRAKEAVQKQLAFIIGMFKSSDPLGIGGTGFSIPRVTGEQLTAREILDRGAKKVDYEYRKDPRSRAVLKLTIGHAYRTLGYYKKAQTQLGAARDYFEKNLAGNELALAECLFSLGWLKHDLGEFDAAEKLYKKALSQFQANLEKDDPRVTACMFNLGWMYVLWTDYEAAQRIFKTVLKLRRQRFGDEDRSVAVARFGLAAVAIEKLNFPTALIESTRAINIVVKLEGKKTLAKAVSNYLKALVLSNTTGDHKRAAELLKETLKLTRSALGNNHPYVALALYHLADELAKDGQKTEAEKCFAECFQIIRTKVGMAHPRVGVAVRGYANFLVSIGQTKKADDLYQEMLHGVKDRYGSKHVFWADALVRYHSFLNQHGNKSAARAKAHEALAAYAKTSKRSVQYIYCLRAVAWDLIKSGHSFKRAESLLSEALERARKRIGKANILEFWTLYDLITARMVQKKYDETTGKHIRAARKIAEARGQSYWFGILAMARLIPGLAQSSKALGKIMQAETAKRNQALSYILMVQMRYCRMTKRSEQGAEAAERLIETTRLPNLLFHAACELSQHMAATQANAKLSSTQRKANQDRYADRAVKALGKAIKHGFSDRKRFAAELTTRLKPLAQRLPKVLREMQNKLR